MLGISTILFLSMSFAKDSMIIRPSLELLNQQESVFQVLTPPAKQCETKDIHLRQLICKNKIDELLSDKSCPQDFITDKKLSETKKSFIDRLGILANHNFELDQKILCNHSFYEQGDKVLEQYVRDGADKTKMSELVNYMNRSEGGRARVAEQLYQIKRHNPDIDLALLLAITFRESGPLTYSNSSSLADTSHNGGLDFFGTNYERLKKYLPSQYKDFASGFNRSKNEHNYVGHSKKVKRRDMIIAYGATLKDVENYQLKYALKATGFSMDDFNKLDEVSKRYWITLCFAGPGGAMHEGETGVPAKIRSSSLGVQTLLSLAKKKIEKGEMTSLSDWHLLTEYDKYTRLNLLRYTIINATALADTLCL